MFVINCFNVAGAGLTKNEGRISIVSFSTLINHYGTARGNDKKEDILSQMFQHPSLKRNNLNSPDAEAFLKFVGKNKPEVERFLKGQTKTVIDNLSMDLKSVMKTRFGINVSSELKSTKQLLESANQFFSKTKSITEKKTITVQDVKEKREIFKEHKADFKEINHRIRQLQSKPNLTSEENDDLKLLLKCRDAIRQDHNDFRQKAKMNNVSTLELDNLFIDTEIFKPQELYAVNQPNPFSSESTNSDYQAQENLNTTSSSISQKLFTTLQQLISDIRGSKVREMLAEAKKEIEAEIKKIEENKQQFRKDLEAIEKRKISDKELDGRIQTLKNTVKSIDVELNKEVDDLISKLPKEVQKEIKGLENKLKAAFQSILNDKNLSSEEKMMMVVNMLKKFDEMIKNQISNPNNQTNNQLDSQKILENINKAFPNIIANASTGLNVKNDRAALIMDDTEMMLDKLENDSVDSISKTLGLPKNQVEVILNKLSPEQKKTIQTIGDIKKALKDIVNEIKKITNKGSMELNLADTEKDTQKVLEQIENTIGDIKSLIKGSKLTINQLMEANTILLALDNMEKKIESGQESPQKSMIA